MSNIGVPQGTRCGPILWNIFIKSLQLSENIIKYADDLTIFTTIPKSESTNIAHGHSSTASDTISKEATMSAEWCQNNGMTLITSKTKQMAMSLRNKITLETPVCINNKVIERGDSFKLLGVNIEEHLTFHKHAESIVERSHVKVHALQLLKRYAVRIIF